MSRPTARVLALLELLQSGGTQRLADLAARLGVDERTVRRYATHLADLDIPVTSVRGRHGGYRLAPGFRMPPLMLTDDEALAVLLGLATAARRGSAPSAEAADTAIAKLTRVLPDALRHRLDALLETARFTEPRRPTPTAPASVLLTLAQATDERRPVAIAYASADGRRSERVLYPYGIVAHAGRWYVTGADSASGEVRTFRLDRISSPFLQHGSFERPEGFDPREQVLTGLAEAPHTHQVSLRARAEPAEVLAALPPGIATVHDLDAADPDVGRGWVRVRIQADRLEWLPAVLAGLAHPFVVEGPEELKVLVQRLARRLEAAATPAEVRPT
jgi:predicted DNA-binding transcriptional regulator YafY